jgi:hypothetical protein
MNVKYKKSLKIVTLLITSIFIATAAVHAYSELFMYGSGITITDSRVALVNGADTPTISTNQVQDSGTTVTFDTITIAVDEELTYDEAVNIQNTAGSAKDIDLTVTSLTGHFSDNFEYIYITMFNPSAVQQGAQIRMLASGTNVTTTGTGVSIPDGQTWTVQWIIKASVDATADESIDITVQLTVQ